MSATRRVRRWAVVLAVIAPINVLSLAACYATRPSAVPPRDERELAAWVRSNTPRDAVFIDDDRQVRLLVDGPRRYYFGSESYAQQWGYDPVLMSQRRHVRDALLRGGPFDVDALTSLADIPDDTYLIVREAHATGPWKDHPTYFHLVYGNASLELYRIDRDACRSDASRGAVSTVRPVVRDPLVPTGTPEDSAGGQSEEPSQ